MPTRLSIALLAFVASCHSAAEAVPGCPEGQVKRDEACVPRIDDCGLTGVSVVGGGCATVGVPPTECGDGFASDGEGGCTAKVPAECAAGTYALPGDAACHAVPCDEPDTTGAVRVDAKAPPGGDGTASKPFASLDAAVTASAPGSTLVVEPGTYDEHVTVAKAVVIRGRCGGPVLVRGSDPARPTLTVTGAAELHQLAVTGPYVAILAGNAKGIVIDRIHVHDAGRNGMYFLDEGGGSDVVVRDSFVEKTKGAAFVVSSANVTMERVAARDITTHPAVARTSGYALHLRHQEVAGKARAQGAVVHLKRARFASLVGVGIVNESSELHAEGVYLAGVDRGTIGAGYGLVSGTSKTLPGGTATTELLGSVIEGTMGFGLVTQGGAFVVERCTVRGVATDPDKSEGFGIVANVDPATGVRSTLQLRKSAIRSTHTAAVAVSLSDATLEDCLIRGVTPRSDTGNVGDGVVVTDTHVTLTRVLITEVARAGVATFLGVVSLGGSTVRCAAFPLDLEPSFKDPKTGVTYSGDARLEDLGGNACGCEALGACTAQSSALLPISSSL